jgi:hypothetical protein
MSPSRPIVSFSAQIQSASLLGVRIVAWITAHSEVDGLPMPDPS